MEREPELNKAEHRMIQILNNSFLKSEKSHSQFSSPDFPDFDVLWERSRSNTSLPSDPYRSHKVTKLSQFISIRRKQFRIASGLLAACLGMVFLLEWKGFAWASLEKAIFPNYHAKVTQVHGSVFLLNSDGSPRVSVHQLEKIPSGEWILVDRDSFIDLSITPTASVRVQANSKVRLESLYSEPGEDRIKIFLSQGTILSHVAKIKKTSDFVIRTDWGNVEVRGTKFFTHTHSEGIRVGVSEGRVEFDRKGNSLELVSGFQLESSSESPVQRPLDYSAKKLLSELEYLKIETGKKEDPEGKLIRSEEDLFRIYSILESVHYGSGKTVRGVVYGMDDDYLYIRTVEEELKIRQDQIQDVEKIR